MENEKIQKRVLIGSIEIEKRADGEESRTISGKGVVFDEFSDAAGYYLEKVDRDAFSDVDMSDVIATFNHNMDNIMARTTNTLKLEVKNDGLYYSFEAPKTTAGNDLLENIRNGNVVGSSFMFTIKERQWNFYDEKDDRPDEMVIKKVDQLIEIGPVTLPFYKTTTAQSNALVVDEIQARDIYNAAKQEHDPERKTDDEEKPDLRSEFEFV